MMQYINYHMWGMNIIWWLVWMALILYIFVSPYKTPGQSIKKETPLEVLKKRYASGELNIKEFKEKKKRIE